MNPVATAANVAWWLTNLPGWWAFDRALRDPATAQHELLHRMLRRSADTAFGREHRFAEISTYQDFANRVPIRDYDEMEPWINRIRHGATNVLTPDPVIRFATTSGTSGARKLIPYTSQLQAEFNRAIGPWIADLFHSTPSLMCGSAYWSITPLARQPEAENSAVPIGFEDDSAYVGGIRRRLIDAVMAVPSEVRHAKSMDECRRLTLHHLLRRRDLRLISIWHPSFLNLLLHDTTQDVSRLWPNLRLLSCWGDGHAGLSLGELRSRFPGVTIQPKGLIATEAIVSIPFRSQWPLAIRSHFFEFVADSGEIVRSHQLHVGQQYSVIVTTSGGLWRYRLNDLIVVNGHLEKTPSIRFIGKAGNISDRFGEKLSEPFVAQAIRTLGSEMSATWSFAMLAPEGSSYVLFIEGDADSNIVPRLDALLRENPQYAYCRDLGQIKMPRIFRIEGGAFNSFIARLNGLGVRCGDIKPQGLSTIDVWSQHFVGHFTDID